MTKTVFAANAAARSVRPCSSAAACPQATAFSCCASAQTNTAALRALSDIAMLAVSVFVMLCAMGVVSVVLSILAILVIMVIRLAVIILIDRRAGQYRRSRFSV